MEVNAGRRQFETRGVQKVRHSANILMRLQHKNDLSRLLLWRGDRWREF